MSRVPCCVPHCRRTRRPWDGMGANPEWICGKHWPQISKVLRRRDAKLLRRYRKKFGNNNPWAYPGGSPERIESVRLAKLLERSWAACKAQAIERAMGI